MSRDRGYIPRKQKLRELLYAVEVPRPPGGLWCQLDDIHAWCRARCGNKGYHTTSREDRSGPGMPRTFLRVHFASEQDAQAFAGRFGVPFPPPVDRGAV